MDTEPTSNVVRGLLHAAEHKRVLPYGDFHTMFKQGTPLATRYQILESAVRIISNVSDIDYGVLLATDSGLPGPDFFKRYRKHRYDDFVRVMGDPRYSITRRKLQRILVAQERARVYVHVLTLHHLADQRECA